MANIGFKFARKGQNILTVNAQNTVFSSAYPMDKVLLDIIGVNQPHGLTYKPTILGYRNTGNKSASYVDNYQITQTSTERAIVLFQQGT